MRQLPNPQTSSIDDILSALESSITNGLEKAEIIRRIKTFGPNSVAHRQRRSLLLLFMRQFINPMSFLLLFAMVISLAFGELLDGISIGIVTVINSIIGFLMEYKAGSSMEALRKLVKLTSRVIRDGTLQEAPSDQIVPGDILFLEAGDIVAADARLLQSYQLTVNESSLTGESLPVEKNEKTLAHEQPLAERKNIIFKGTAITSGNARAIVVSTGATTELGKVEMLVGDATQPATPLEKKLSELSTKLIWVTGGLVIIIFTAGVTNGHPLLNMFETAVALAVAAIPEGLPIVATLALAQGMLNMASRNVIVRKLSSVETLGGTTVICTDKTGTLTENRIEVGKLAVRNYILDVSTYSSQEHLPTSSETSVVNSNAFAQIQLIAAICNTSELTGQADSWTEVGDPLETGLQRFAIQFGADLANLKIDYRKINEVAFSSETKIMISFHRTTTGYYVAAKGAVEELLERCSWICDGNEVRPLDAKEKTWWISTAESISGEGLRTIAFAYKNSSDTKGDSGTDLILAGLTGLIDPPRAGIREAIAECHSAGINVIMVTGDHPATARNIAFKLGISSSEDESVIIGKSMSEASSLTQEEKNIWLSTKIFARVSPRQKLDLITVLQEDQQIVGMTGDGINDAPALQKADIGIAMGIRGTQVAQEVADMILKDDSFTSVVSAVKQGRAIFDNIRKFIIYLLSCNLSELFIVSISSVLSFHFQLIPLQILFLNIVTDVLPALALGMTEPRATVMLDPPRKSTIGLIGRREWISISSYSAVLTTVCIGAVLSCHYLFDEGSLHNEYLCNNVLFLTLICSQLLHVFNMTSGKIRFFGRSEITNNKYVWYALAGCVLMVAIAYLVPASREALALQRMTINEWIIIIAFSSTGLLLIQGLKYFKIVR